MDKLPADVIFSIALWLSIKALLRFEQTCNRILQVCKRPLLYDPYLKKLMIKQEGNSSKKDILNFMAGKMPLRSEDGLINYRTLHVFVAKIIGIDAFMDLPILNLGTKMGHTGYLDFVKNDDLSAPVMKGIDCYSRPFIAFRYINRKINKTQTLVIFHRYTDGEALAIGSAYYMSCFTHSRMRQRDLAFFERLLLHKPCGGHKEMTVYSDSSDNEEEIKTMPNGQSIIEIV